MWPGTERWVLDLWLDATTAVGVVLDGPGGPTRVDPADRQTLIACTVPAGACEVYAETTGLDVRFPQRTGRAVSGLLLSGESS